MKIEKASTHRHPQWCDRDHAASWPVHSHTVGEASVPNGTVEVVLTQYADRAPTVTLYRDDPAETVVYDLASGLAVLLAQAVDALGGVR